MSVREGLAKVLMTQIPVERVAAPDAEDHVTGGAGGKPAGGGTGGTGGSVGGTGGRVVSNGGATLDSPIFANYKAITFPGLVALISAAWSGLPYLGEQFASPLVPLVLSILLGGALTALELLEDDVTPSKRKVFGGLVGLCNCMVLFSAVVGASTIRQNAPGRPPVAQADSGKSEPAKIKQENAVAPGPK